MKRPWDAIVWWEKRRILFNLLVLAAGIVSCLVVFAIGSRLVTPGEDVEEPLGIILGVIIYGVAANACYTLGWITELLWSWGDTQSTEANRSKVFRVGIIFSVVLTLSPGVLIPAIWAIWGFK
jgi:hypothetical protein